MAVQLSVTARNDRLNAIETTVGTAPLLTLRTGAAPANCAAADTGTLLATITLPSDWLAAAASGAKALAGSWAGTGAAAGDIAHFRIKDSTGTTTHIQGTVTATGGGGDMTVNNVTIAVDQSVSVTTFTMTDGNA